MIMTAIASLVGKIAGDTVTPIVTQYIAGKQEEARLAQEYKQAQLNGKIQVELATAAAKAQAAADRENYDLVALQNMKTTWKDEALLLLIFTPLVMGFIPSLAPYSAAGFQALAEAPMYYKLMAVGIVSATFGLRWMDIKGKLTGGK